MQLKLANTGKAHAVLCLIYFVGFLAIMVTPPDAWWSLRIGQDMFRGVNPFRENYSWTAEGSYYPNHEWLWQALLYGLWLLGGETLLVAYALHGLLFASIFLFIWPSDSYIKEQGLKKKHGFFVFVIFLPIFPLAFQFNELRAQIVSLALAGLLLFLLRREKFWPIPLIVLLWANFHGGVLTGILMLAIASIMGIAFWLRTGNRRDRAVRLGLVSLLAFGATFATPLGWRMWSYIFESRAKTQVSIWEWQSAFQADQGLLVLLVFLTLVFLIFGWKYAFVQLKNWDTAVPLVLSLVLLILSYWVIRFLPFALVALAPTFTVYSMHFLAKLKLKLPPVIFQPVLLRCLTVSLMLVLGLVSSLALYTTHRTDQLHHIDADAQAKIKTYECFETMYTDYSAGSYLVWFFPDLPVFLDNRYDPYPAFATKYLDLLPDNEWQKFFQEQKIECAWVLNSTVSQDQLELARWKKVYSSQVWTLYAAP